MVRDTFGNLVYAASSGFPSGLTIEDFWSGLEEWFYAEQITTVQSAFLPRFECEVTDVEIAAGLRIHKLSDDEHSRWMNEGRIRHGIDAHFVKWHVVWEYRSPRSDYLRGEFKPSLIEAACLALRLLKPGGVGLRFWRHRSKYPIVFFGGTRGEAERECWGDPYQLKSSEIEDLRRLFERVAQAGFVDFSPSKRFGDSYHEIRPAERLADLVIALEGLFAPEKDDSISYRIAMRGAKLLGSTAEPRRSMFRLIKDVYGLRSKLFHGGNLETDKDVMRIVRRHGSHLWDLVKKTEELVRAGLRHRLMYPDRFGQEAMDEAVLN